MIGASSAMGVVVAMRNPAHSRIAANTARVSQSLDGLVVFVLESVVPDSATSWIQLDSGANLDRRGSVGHAGL